MNRAKTETADRLGMLLRFLLFFAALFGAFYLVWQGAAPWWGSGAAAGPVEAFFLQTREDANCTLIRQGDAVVLVDTGEAQDGPDILEFLEEQGVEAIDYLILTHPDKDHIGGAKLLLEKLPVGRIFMPYYAKEHQRLEALMEVIEAKGVSVIHPTRSRSFVLGEMHFTVYPPLEGNYKKDNNYSLAVLLRHREVRMVFAGDAEEKRLGELMRIHWPETSLYQVAHHGRSSPSSAAFFELLHPEVAVVNALGSDQEIVAAADKVGARLYHTRLGTLQVVSDGKALTVIEPTSEPITDTTDTLDEEERR